MEGRVLYEISVGSYLLQVPLWLLPLFCVIWCGMTVGKIREVRQNPKAGGRFDVSLLLFGCAVILFVLVLVGTDQFAMYDETVGAYRRGEYETVEGYVENLKTPNNGGDTFTINGVNFRYGATLSWGYNKKNWDWGSVITGNGQHLRIRYTTYKWLGRVMLYIEELP